MDSINLVKIGPSKDYKLTIVVAVIIILLIIITIIQVYSGQEVLDIIFIDVCVLILSIIIGLGYLDKPKKLVPIHDIVDINDIHIELQKKEDAISLNDIDIYLNDQKSDLMSDIKKYLDNKQNIISNVKAYLNNKSEAIINSSKDIINKWLSKKYNKIVPLDELKTLDKINNNIPISVLQTEMITNNKFNLNLLNTSNLHNNNNDFTFVHKDVLLPVDSAWVKDMDHYITNLDKYAFFTLYSYNDNINRLISLNVPSYIEDYIKKDKNWADRYFPFFYTAIEFLQSRSNNININKNEFLNSIIINQEPNYIMDIIVGSFNKTFDNDKFNGKSYSSFEILELLIDNNISYSDKYILLSATAQNLSFESFWKIVIDYHLINLHEIINKSPALVEPLILYGQAIKSNNQKINNLETFTIANLNMGPQMITLMPGTHAVLLNDMTFLINNNSYYYNINSEDIVITF